MIRQLRKRHVQVWSILLFLVPAAIVMAWLAIPVQECSRLLQPASGIGLPVIIGTVSKQNYTVNLRTDSNRLARQLEWINRSSLTSPSALIYKITAADKNITAQDLIGRIDTRGNFYFPLKADGSITNRFILYDIIHNQVIDTINFKL